MLQPISRDSVPIGVEDRFLIVGIRKAVQLCPSASDGHAINRLMELAGHAWPGLTAVFDFRGLEQYYYDVAEFVEAVAAQNPAQVIVGSKHEASQWQERLDRSRFQVLQARGRCRATSSLDLKAAIGDSTAFCDRESHFSVLAEDALYMTEIESREANGISSIIDLQQEDAEVYGNAISSDELHDLGIVGAVRQELVANAGQLQAAPESAASSFAALWTALPRRRLTRFDRTVRYVGEVIAASHFHAVLRSAQSPSSLSQFAISIAGETISCGPFHANAIHQVELPGPQQLLIGRPAVFARATQSVMSREVAQFQEMLNDRQLREVTIQRFLETNPNFLRGLNYQSLYPQLVLERDDGTTLRPDFFLEPHEDGWCDILDVKLPKQRILVGGRDRRTLAAGIHEVVAQLREYAAYFEEARHRGYVREKYGLNVYRPRLIALVGRDMADMSDAQVRRAMTQYSDCQIMTFDQLLRHSRSRLLI